MKKTIKLLAFFMMIAMLSVSLASCTVLMGKYSSTTDILVAESTTTYEFGILGTVTRTVVSEALFGDPETVITEGKYEIFEDAENPDQLKIAFEFEGEERAVYSFAQGTENGVNYIKIAGVQYNVVE